MSGNNLLLDTNIVLYLLGGDTRISAILQDTTIYVSFITELELLGYKGLTASEKRNITAFLKDVFIIDINENIKELTIDFRKSSTLKLPDAIVGATSTYLQIPLFTADSQFKAISNFDLVYYEL